MKTSTFLFYLLGAMLITTAYAEETNFGKRVPTTAEVIEALHPNATDSDVSNEGVDDENSTKTDVKTRSITYNYVTENIFLQGQAPPHLL